MAIYLTQQGPKAIYIGNKNITPWTPGADTLIYLPLKTNSNDQSGNGNHGVNTNITFSNNKAVFDSDGTSCILIDNTSLPTYNYTLHMIIARTTNTGYQLAFRYSNSGGYDNARCYISGYGTYTDGGVIHQQTNIKVCENGGGSYNFGLVDTDSSEHLWSFVVYEDSGYTYLRCFIDGQYQYQIYTSNNYYTGKISFGNRRWMMNEGLKGTMREVIMEDKVWTDNEVYELAQQYGFAN